jgi:hypothetical protein
MGELVINDRRRALRAMEGEIGDVAPQPVAPPEPIKIEAPVDKSAWLDVTYLIAFAQNQQQGMVILGRAVGVRSDEQLCIADWQLPPRWTAGLDWTKIARQRLDTFLNCDCGRLGPCASHRMMVPQWAIADHERIARMMEEEIPLALQRLMMAERAARVAG